jgi:hypothetical protein
MMTFQEYFAEGERRGWKPPEAAERLLRGIREPSAQGRVIGVCRESHCIIPTMEEQRATIRAAEKIGRNPVDLPERWNVVRRDFEPTPVPWQTWIHFERIDPDLISFWNDDDEKPMEWARVCWIAGTVETSDWYSSDDPNVGRVELEYTSLQIAPNLANELLSYSDDELRDIILAWPGTNGTVLEHHYKEDPKLGGRTQGDIRELWRRYRNPGGKRGKAAKAIRDEVHSSTK